MTRAVRTASPKFTFPQTYVRFRLYLPKSVAAIFRDWFAEEGRWALRGGGGGGGGYIK